MAAPEEGYLGRCKVKNPIDKKTAAIFALLVMLVITGLGWVWAESKPERVLPLPGGIDNWTQYFLGYEAYLDRDISGSIVGGTSMVPTFGDNDLVLWVGVDNVAGLKVGDIIIFQHPIKPWIDNIILRIIEVDIQSGVYRFGVKGDNLLEPADYWVPEGDVHGLVIGVVYDAISG